MKLSFYYPWLNTCIELCIVSYTESFSQEEAQHGRALADKFTMSVDSWDNHCGKKEMTYTSCPLIVTLMLWYLHNTHPLNH